LRRSPDVEVVAAFAHDEALRWTAEWRDIDIAIVDAAAEDNVGDQFPGVAVVRKIRANTARSRPVVIVVTAHSLHDGLRHRMARADADFLFFRGDLRSAEQLVDVVLHPEQYRRDTYEPPDPNLPRMLGVAEGSDVEQLIAYVEDHQLQGALDPEHPSRDDPRSRRWLRHRKNMAEAAGIEPVNLTTGDRPLDQDAPSIRQLARVWAWAARVRRRGDP
jgi:CheY-like chemotaxis protein